MPGCWILKRVWSVCAHDQSERVWCDNVDCVEVVMDTHTELMIGWCPACEAHYSPADVRSELVILNYWQYKARRGLDRPVDASFVPLKDTPPSPFEERVRERTECIALADAVITPTSRPPLPFASVHKHIEQIRAQTLEWARCGGGGGTPAVAAAAAAMKPRALHLITDLEPAASAPRVRFDQAPRKTRAGPRSWRPASPHPSALPARFFDLATAAGDDDDDEVSLNGPVDGDDEQAEHEDSSVLIPVKLDLSAETPDSVRAVSSALFEQRLPVSPRRVPLPLSPPAIVPLPPTTYSPGIKHSGAPSTRSSPTWTSSSSFPAGSESPRSSASCSPSAPPRPHIRLASCAVHGQAYDVRNCFTCDGLMLDEKAVAPARWPREAETKVVTAVSTAFSSPGSAASSLCACGGRGRCFHCLSREGSREEKEAMGVARWI